MLLKRLNGVSLCCKNKKACSQETLKRTGITLYCVYICQKGHRRCTYRSKIYGPYPFPVSFLFLFLFFCTDSCILYYQSAACHKHDIYEFCPQRTSYLIIYCSYFIHLYILIYMQAYLYIQYIPIQSFRSTEVSKNEIAEIPVKFFHIFLITNDMQQFSKIIVFRDMKSCTIKILLHFLYECPISIGVSMCNHRICYNKCT